MQAKCAPHKPKAGAKAIASMARSHPRHRAHRRHANPPDQPLPCRPKRFMCAVVGPTTLAAGIVTGRTLRFNAINSLLAPITAMMWLWLPSQLPSASCRHAQRPAASHCTAIELQQINNSAGIKHGPLNALNFYGKIMEKICLKAPYYYLGPTFSILFAFLLMVN